MKQDWNVRFIGFNDDEELVVCSRRVAMEIYESFKQREFICYLFDGGSNYVEVHNV